jgi:hypothetical protein
MLTSRAVWCWSFQRSGMLEISSLWCPGAFHRRSIMLIYEGSLRGLTAVAHKNIAGKVHSLLFDDRSWDVQHVAVRTGLWPLGRIVVIPSATLTIPDWCLDRLAVDLEQDQVDSGLDIDSAPPVSRQEEIRIQQQQGSTFGVPLDGFSAALMVPTATAERDLAESSETILAGCDPHLRSTRGVRGYRVRLRSGETLGRAEDFLLDTARWKISHIVIRWKGWPHPRRFVVRSSAVETISWHEQTIDTRLSSRAHPKRSRTPIAR